MSLLVVINFLIEKGKINRALRYIAVIVQCFPLSTFFLKCIFYILLVFSFVTWLLSPEPEMLGCKLGVQ